MQRALEALAGVRSVSFDAQSRLFRLVHDVRLTPADIETCVARATHEGPVPFRLVWR